MHFLEPLGALAFIAALAILALYMLRRQYTEMEIPSTYLWRKTLADHTASRPIQKLKRNLLMFLQLLVVLAAAFALMRPALQGQTAGETVLIFDLSASMQAEGRLDKAKEEAKALIESMGDEDRVSILCAGQETKQLLMRSADRRAALAAVAGLEAENGSASLAAAISLATAMAEEIEGLGIVVFSDAYTAPENSGIRVWSPANGTENRALVSVSIQENGLGIARIVNYGGACNLTVEAYADGILADVRILSAEAGETGSVKFQLPAGTREAEVRIREEDALMADNYLQWVWRDAGTIQVVLAGDGNVFWEKALLLREGLILTRTTAQEMGAVRDADLYISEGETTLIARAGETTAMMAGELQQSGGTLAIAASDTARALCENMSLDGVYVKQFRPISGGTPILTINGETAAAMENGCILLGFDVSDSNLPMKYDFPVFVQNLLDTLLPDAVNGLDNGNCGETVMLSLNPRAISATITTPRDRALAVSSGRFTDTLETGIYTLRQQFSDGSELMTAFVMKIPLAESDLREVAASSTGQSAIAAGSYGREISRYAMLLLLAFLMLEWGVSRHGPSVS